MGATLAIIAQRASTACPAHPSPPEANKAYAIDPISANRSHHPRPLTATAPKIAATSLKSGLPAAAETATSLKLRLVSVLARRSVWEARHSSGARPTWVSYPQVASQPGAEVVHRDFDRTASASKVGPCPARRTGLVPSRGRSSGVP
jgi:hypothetical protein